MKTTIVGCATALFALGAFPAQPADADEVFLTSGGTISGIVRSESDWVTVEVPSGTVSLSSLQVVRIERARHVLHEYYEKYAPLEKSKDAKALHELAAWAKEKGLTRFTVELSKRVLALEPEHEGSHLLLGHEKRGGSWLTPDEAKRADGLVQFRGRWIAEAERDRILREEEEARQAALERYEQRKREEEERRKATATRAGSSQQGETLTLGINSRGESSYHRSYTSRSRYGRGGRGLRGIRGSIIRRPGSTIRRPGGR